MKKLNDSTEKAKAAHALLHELAKEVAPNALVKATVPPANVPKAKPERRILQTPATQLAVVAG